jgi:hypothetical protein
MMLKKFANVFCFVWLFAMAVFFADWILDILAQ